MPAYRSRTHDMKRTFNGTHAMLMLSVYWPTWTNEMGHAYTWCECGKQWETVEKDCAKATQELLTAMRRHCRQANR